ncbi:MAG: hypothetical protein NWE88_02250 [Candidatus Bathyarchaeota archaeon]|nr:hypothetical protein [Candidatus Bathyarchaeota archaeon]
MAEVKKIILKETEAAGEDDEAEGQGNQMHTEFPYAQVLHIARIILPVIGEPPQYLGYQT